VRPIVILQHEADSPPAIVARALEDLGVAFEVRRLDLGDALPAYPDEASGLIVLGGSMHVHQGSEYKFLDAEKSYLRALLKHSAPIWGICLGAQLLTLAAGGEVYERAAPEIGWTTIAKTLDDPLLHGIGSPFVAFEWHVYSCKLPPFGQLVAERGDGLQVFRAGGRAWGTQFHPEVDGEMIERWVADEVKDLEHRFPGLAEAMSAETPRRLAANEAFCRRLTSNFVLTSGLLPAEKE
jgi:GMP synthase-like glutamine amidotransferase